MNVEMNVHTFCENVRIKPGFVFGECSYILFPWISLEAGTLLRCILSSLEGLSKNKGESRFMPLCDWLASFFCNDIC